MGSGIGKAAPSTTCKYQVKVTEYESKEKPSAEERLVPRSKAIEVIQKLVPSITVKEIDDLLFPSPNPDSQKDLASNEEPTEDPIFFITPPLKNHESHSDGKLLEDKPENVVSTVLKRLSQTTHEPQAELDTIRDMNLFILDNSIRESMVGQIFAHTVENKKKIFEHVKHCGMKHIIVAAFSQQKTADDEFVRELMEKPEELEGLHLYGFAECIGRHGVSADGKPIQEKIPVGLCKLQESKLNVVLELDLLDARIDWNLCTVHHLCTLLQGRISWIRKNVASSTKIFINYRDFPMAMEKQSERVLMVTHFLASMPPAKRIFGLLWEEPTGSYMPNEMNLWTSCVRQVMNACGWSDGLLLVHVHKKWGMADCVQLEAQTAGANGIWCSLSAVGSAMGHACSTLTVMNLVRMGNQNVLKQYNCNAFREAAIAITTITTGEEPSDMQELYGERALDLVFDLTGIAGGLCINGEDFDLAKFFGVAPVRRITPSSSPQMIIDVLKEKFGDNDQFTTEMAEKMKLEMEMELRSNEKHEFMSTYGLAMLFRKVDGDLTPEMLDIINKVDELDDTLDERLIEEIREEWDEWDSKEGAKSGDDTLEFDSFYHAFMMPYFGCYHCEDTREALKSLDIDVDNGIDWNEFVMYLKWALKSYPITTKKDLISKAFRKGIIPTMQDQITQRMHVLNTVHSVRSITVKRSISVKPNETNMSKIAFAQLPNTPGSCFRPAAFAKR